MNARGRQSMGTLVLVMVGLFAALFSRQDHPLMVPGRASSESQSVEVAAEDSSLVADSALVAHSHPTPVHAANRLPSEPVPSGFAGILPVGSGANHLSDRAVSTEPPALLERQESGKADGLPAEEFLPTHDRDSDGRVKSTAQPVERPTMVTEPMRRVMVVNGGIESGICLDPAKIPGGTLHFDGPRDGVPCELLVTGPGAATATIDGRPVTNVGVPVSTNTIVTATEPVEVIIRPLLPGSPNLIQGPDGKG